MGSGLGLVWPFDQAVDETRKLGKNRWPIDGSPSAVFEGGRPYAYERFK